jgi:hypothetical protein
MFIGVGVFGVVAASVAAWFVSTGQRERDKQQSEAISALTAEVADLRAAVSALSSQLGDHAGQPAEPQNPDSHTSAAA